MAGPESRRTRATQTNELAILKKFYFVMLCVSILYLYLIDLFLNDYDLLFCGVSECVSWGGYLCVFHSLIVIVAIFLYFPSSLFLSYSAFFLGFSLVLLDISSQSIF